MNKETVINVRLEEKLKTRATKALKNKGLSLSAGIRIFLTHVSNGGKIVFEDKAGTIEL